MGTFPASLVSAAPPLATLRQGNDDATADQSGEDQVAARVEEFLAHHRGRRAIGQTTVAVYRRALEAIERADCDVDALTPTGFHQLADERGWGASTRATYWNAVKQYTAFRFRAGLADGDPFADTRAPRRPPQNPRPVGPAELAQPRATSARRAGARPSTRPVDEWLTLAAYAGLRTCEIARVRGEHLRHDSSGYVLDVPNGKGGTNATIPAHPEVVKVVSRKQRGLLYPGTTARDVQGAGKRLFMEAGLDGGLHRLRHTYASWIYQQTKDPFLTQRLCRHRSLNSTLAYAAVVDQQLHDAIGGLHR
jgi:integrase/recombinase XerD